MEWVNYHHLLYFWLVVKENGLKPAADKLRLSHPTLSTQIKQLEHNLGEELLVKQGRRLTLTETGRLVFQYAEEIFALGHEMLDALREGQNVHSLKLHVGIVDAVPKTMSKRLLEPAFELTPTPTIFCHEGRYETLLKQLTLHQLDIVIANAPVPEPMAAETKMIKLAASGMGLFATKRLAKIYRKDFPRSLLNAPFLLPLDYLQGSNGLSRWLDQLKIKVKVIGQFEDSALCKAMGADGHGIFPAPLIIKDDICRQFKVDLMGQVPNYTELYFAVTVPRKRAHPGVTAICQSRAFNART